MTDVKQQYDPSKLAIVPIQSVLVNEWNPKEKDTKEYKQVVKSLELYGFRQPLLVRNHPTEKNKYQILDGEQRYTAANELEYTEVPVYNLGTVTDEEAKAATIWMEVQVPFDEVDLSHLVVELADLNMELPYTEGQIADFRQMAQFDFSYDDKEGQNDTDDNDFVTFSVRMTSDQRDMVTKAIERVKEIDDVSEGRALELIAGDFLSGMGGPEAKEA